MSEEYETISEDVKELVVARLGVMPLNYKLSMGDEGTFTINEIISEVNNNTRVGREVARIQLNFIKALTTGKFIETLNKK